MPARNVQTNLTVAMQTKGFDKGMRQMLGVSQKALESLRKQSSEYGKVQKSIDGMRDRVQELSKEQLRASESLEKITDKTGAAYKFQEEKMQRAGESAKKLTQQMKLLQQAHQGDFAAMEKLNRSQREMLKLQKQGQQQSRWALTQGMLQGAGMGGAASLFMQRGPGFGRQFAGQMMGGAIRRAGRFGAGMAQAPFGGIQGLQAAVAAIPGGGVIAGQLGAVAGHAQRALQYQRTRLEVSPYVQPATATAASAEARQKLGTFEAGRMAVTPGQIKAGAGRLSTGGTTDLAKGRWGKGGLVGERGQIVDPKSAYGQRIMAEQAMLAEDIQRTGEGGTVSHYDLLPGETATQYDARIAKRKSERKTLQAEVAATRRGTPMARLSGMASRLRGISKQEALQEVGALYQTAGGEYTGLGGQGKELKTVMAARTLYGVSPQAAGGFMLGGRRGGLIGGGEGPGEGLRSALQDALEMGLEGAEITRYMETVASGIQQFQHTGIPMNKDSIKSMGESLSAAGIGGVRASTMARGFQNYVQSMGERGITGGGDIMLLQALGGWKGKGGDEYVKALMRLERMKIEGPEGMQAGGGMNKLITRLIKEGGGGLTGVKFMASYFRSRGMKGSLGEYAMMGERLTGETYLSEEERRDYGGALPGEKGRLERGAARAKGISTAGKMERLAAERITRVAPGQRAQALIANKQIEVGNRALKAVQGLEISSLRLNDSFMTLAGPTLQKVNEGLTDFTKALHRNVEKGGGFSGFLSELFFG